MAETARLVSDNGLNSFDATQTVVYLSLLSCEIALKALLEQSGATVAEIRAKSHNLEQLLGLVCACEINDEVSVGHVMWRQATPIRGIPIESEGAKSTVGTILSGETQGASKYPNQIRYGTGFQSFPADALIKTAVEVINFADNQWDSIRQKEK